MARQIKTRSPEKSRCNLIPSLPSVEFRMRQAGHPVCVSSFLWLWRSKLIWNTILISDFSYKPFRGNGGDRRLVEGHCSAENGGPEVRHCRKCKKFHSSECEESSKRCCQSTIGKFLKYCGKPWEQGIPRSLKEEDQAYELPNRLSTATPRHSWSR